MKVMSARNATEKESKLSRFLNEHPIVITVGNAGQDIRLTIEEAEQLVAEIRTSIDKATPYRPSAFSMYGA